MKKESSNIQFILPPKDVLKKINNQDYSYSIYNYYGHGLIAQAKRRRFAKALQLGGNIPSNTVIDMGTADGVLLPTLALNYSKVVAIDSNKEFLRQASDLCRLLNLSNVDVYSNSEIAQEELKSKIAPGCQLMYLLETLEHVGTQPDVWQSKINFLRECFQLIERGGHIIISVPKMIGPILFFKNVIQRVLRLGYDPMTWKQLFYSSFLNNTDELEPLWNGHHVGFNHIKLESHMKNNFSIVHREESLISVFYVLSEKH